MKNMTSIKIKKNLHTLLDKPTGNNGYVLLFVLSNNVCFN